MTSLFSFKFSKRRTDRVTKTMDRSGSSGKQRLWERIDSVIKAKSSKLEDHS